MRTRSRMLLAFISAHVVFTLVVGAVSTLLLQSFLHAQAESSARSLAAVLTSGGFSPTPAVQQRMVELTGYEFELFELPLEQVAALPGTVRVPFDGGVVRVEYRTPAYTAALRGVWWATIYVGLAGIALFAVIAWWLSSHLSRPLEQLAEATRRIGSGHWQDRIPAVGSGEVQYLRRDLEAMRSALLELDERHRQAERLATLGLFTATIAHEVRNPLSAIRLTIQMLRQRHAQDAALAMIENEIERLDDIVDELLGFSRGMSVQRQPCDLAEVAATVHRLLQRQLQHTGITLHMSGSAMVHADPRRMRQMLLNLVLNAIQALQTMEDEDGRIDISLSSEACAVYDNGPGVPADIQANLFDAFASNREHGTGLGLHLASLIAEAHGCQLHYEPSPTGGAGFVVRGLQAVTAVDKSQ